MSDSNSNDNVHRATVKNFKGKKVMEVKNFIAGPVTIELTPIQQKQLHQGKSVTVKVVPRHVPITQSPKKGNIFSKHQQKHKGGKRTRKIRKHKKHTRKIRKH